MLNLNALTSLAQGSKSPMKTSSYQPLGVEMIPDILTALDLPVGGETVGGACFLGGLLLAWLTWWLGPIFVRFVMGRDFFRIARRCCRWLAVATILSGAYWGWGFVHEGARKALAACEPGYVVAMTLCLTLAAMAAAELLIRWSLRSRENSGQAAMVAQRTASMFIVFAAMITVMRHFGYDIWTLVTAMGVGSLAIGLAAKDTLANTISGVVLMLDQPFRVGDRIKIGANGTSPGLVGEVAEVGLRSTRIRLLDQTILVIPNTELCNSQVVNVSAPGSIGGKIEVLLEPMPVGRLQRLMNRMAEAVPTVLDVDHEDVRVYVVGALDACLRLNILFPVVPDGVLDQYDRANRALMLVMAEEGAHAYDARRRLVAQPETDGRPAP